MDAVGRFASESLPLLELLCECRLELLIACLIVLLVRVHWLAAEGVGLLREILQLRSEGRAPPSILSRIRDAATDGSGGKIEDGQPNDLHPLAESARFFAACPLGDNDVDVARFITACREYTAVLAKLGAFTLLAAREVHS